MSLQIPKPIQLQSRPAMQIFIIYNLKVGDRNGKKSFGQPFIPLLHNAFLALFGAPGRPLKWLKTNFNLIFPTFLI
jgi:hypothetical protein